MKTIKSASTQNSHLNNQQKEIAIVTTIGKVSNLTASRKVSKLNKIGKGRTSTITRKLGRYTTQRSDTCVHLSEIRLSDQLGGYNVQSRLNVKIGLKYVQ